MFFSVLEYLMKQIGEKKTLNAAGYSKDLDLCILYHGWHLGIHSVWDLKHFAAQQLDCEMIKSHN